MAKAQGPYKVQGPQSFFGAGVGSGVASQDGYGPAAGVEAVLPHVADGLAAAFCAIASTMSGGIGALLRAGSWFCHPLLREEGKAGVLLAELGWISSGKSRAILGVTVNFY